MKNNFKDLLSNKFPLKNISYLNPTEVQKKAIPLILSGKDLIVESQTGTGKTAAFAIPTIQLLYKKEGSKVIKIKILILTPTRELADQVSKSYQKYSQNSKIKISSIYGGVNIVSQIKKLRKGVDILIATPGRLLDHIRRKTIDLTNLKIIIMDEADRMLDMGFVQDIKLILSSTPKNTQNILTSATYESSIRKLAESFTNNPAKITIERTHESNPIIDQLIYLAEKQSNKFKILLSILEKYKFDQILIFTRTKIGAERLGLKLKIVEKKVAIIHGDKRQRDRTKSLEKFKNKNVELLVATDVAARGLDIKKLACVINYDVPNQPDDYIHRIGRTGRAKEKGTAISLVSPNESKNVRDIEKQLKIRIKVVNEDPLDKTKKQRKKNSKIRNNKKYNAINSKKRSPKKSISSKKVVKKNNRNRRKSGKREK